MKKLALSFTSLSLCALLTVGSAPLALAAENLPPVIAPNPASETFTLPEGSAYQKDGHTMLPLRLVAETMGFTVTWDEKDQSIFLDNGVVNTRVSIGEDLYYMASSFAIGMSAPAPLGAAPALLDSKTYVPAELFTLLLGEDHFAIDGNKITFQKDDLTQIPNSLSEWKTVEEARGALSYSPKTPHVLPDGYENTYISTISGTLFQMFFNKGDEEIVYRTQKGTGDISGDYNTYETEETETVQEKSVLFKGNADGFSLALWEDGENAYAIRCTSPLSKESLKEMIKSLN